MQYTSVMNQNYTADPLKMYFVSSYERLQSSFSLQYKCFQQHGLRIVFLW